MKTYTPTIGLEIHAELKTLTKMFCGSKNDPEETRPNVNVCPVCMGHPGTLPVANREAIMHVVRVGTAVGGTIADYTEFDRKNYFYPDLPKGYQISQYEFPLVKGGVLSDVQITRIHLEEDTARSSHESESWSLVDFNRSGVPLMELVTEPVIHDADTAMRFAEELQILLRTLGAGDANMEKGQMRVEANISVSDDDVLGTKVEVKNLNSFRSVGRAIAFEVDRQIRAIESGGVINQETRGWDEARQKTYSQRAKESSHDYRYFPDPDIPKLRLSRLNEFSSVALHGSMPELPWERRMRLIGEGIDAKSAEILVGDLEYARVYEANIRGIQSVEQRKIAINLLLTTVRGLNPDSRQLARLGVQLPNASDMRLNNRISSTSAGTVLTEILRSDEDFQSVAQRMGLVQIRDESLIDEIVEHVIAENSAVVEQVQAGKHEALRYLIGQGMRKSRGAVNPELLESAIRARLEK